MFDKLLKSPSTDKRLLSSESQEMKSMRVEMDELQLKMDDEYEEVAALNQYYTKEATHSSTGSSANYDVVDEDIDFRTLQALYASEGWFYIVVQAITKAIISLPMKMEKKKITTERVELPNGEMEDVRNEVWITASGEAEFDIFKHPSDMQTSLEFFMLVIIDLLSLGNTYIWIDRGEGGIEVDRPTARLQEAMRRSNHGINGIYRINAALIEPLVEEGVLGVSAYGLMSAEGYVKFDASEMLHIKMPHPGNPVLGLSPIVPVLKNVLIDRFTSEHMIRFYKQGARLGGVIKTTKKLTKEQVTRLTRNFEANFSGKKNHHKTLILPEGMDYETIEVNPGETSLIDFSKFNKEPILSTYSVPPVRVGLLDGATYANALIQDKAFWENAVKPIIMILEDGFSNSGKIIKRERRLRFGWDLSDVEALQENLKDKAEIGKNLAQGGWTIDEVREKHWKLPKLAEGEGGNLNPLVERTRRGGDISNGFQLSAPETDQKTQSANAQSDQDTVTDITGTEQTFEQRVGELTAINVAAGLSPAIAAQEAVTRTLEEGLKPGVSPEVSTQENNEDPNNDPAPVIEDPAEEDEGKTIERIRITSLPGMDEDAIKTTMKALTGEDVDELISEKLTETRETFSRMEPLFLEAAKSIVTDKSGRINKRKHLIKTLRNKADEGDDGLPSGKDIAKFADKEVAENPSKVDPKAMEVGHANTITTHSLTFPNEVALESIKAEAAKKIVRITDTTKSQIRNVIADAFSKQSTPKELANMISDKFAEISEGRAMTIARTETLSAVSEGQELKKNQFLTELPELAPELMKAWIDADDTKVRHSHELNDDQGPIPHDQKFSNGLMYPRERGGEAKEVINCRCAVIYFHQEEQAGIEETLADSLVPSII